MKQLITSIGVSTAFIIGAHIPCFGHDWPGVALIAKIIMFFIGYILMDIYGRNYWKWMKNV